jgi:hypothetical protein
VSIYCADTTAYEDKCTVGKPTTSNLVSRWT